MVTICTDQICRFILSDFSIAPVEWYIESNYSGDKKATSLSFSRARGKKVTSEIVLPRKIIEAVLRTSPEKICKYWLSSTLAVIQSGAIGAQGHVANGLTALFIACGQDVACISESSIGLTRMETNSNGDLYVSVTLPSLIVGTVGGGTALPTQNECLEMLDCRGNGKARKFAEICGAVALAGEISIASAMSVDHFTKSHQKLGRRK
jgi:hydroxymethylglutaryl-CoA reductase (NADPH)